MMTVSFTAESFQPEGNEARQRRRFRHSQTKYSFLFLSASLPLLILFFPHATHSQSENSFGVNRLLGDVKRRFKLSPSDVTKIKPLINEENKNVIQIYARFSGDEPEYSNRVWQEIVERRREFESGIKADLTTRQKAALRAARTGMERRALNYLVQDYVSFLGQYLELEEFEYDDLQSLFETENSRKYFALTQYLLSPKLLQREFESINAETELKMQKILSCDQWRLYNDMFGPERLIA